MQYTRLTTLLLTAILLGCSPSQRIEESTSTREDEPQQVLVHLKNIPQGNKHIPGSKGQVEIQKRGFHQKTQTLDGMATFYEIPLEEVYTISGYHQSSSTAFNYPTEYWGTWKNISITDSLNEFTFVRKTPYILDVRTRYSRNNWANPSLEEGEEVRIEVLVNNPSNKAHKVRVNLLLKNMQTGHVETLEKTTNIQAGAARAKINLEFIAREAGEHHFAAGLYLPRKIKQWTDCWDWSESPMFFVAREHRTLEFAGYIWDVKAGFGNPGANLWSNDTSDVWVDETGRLHLTLSLKDNHQWYATEVISQKEFGYGTFTFFIEAEPMYYDPHVVAGIFLYRDEQNEIDIEFSRWGDKNNYQFGNYVIQPADNPGNHFRFPLLTTGTFTTHRVKWSPDEVIFSSWHGHYPEAPDDKIIAQWQYTGPSIPVPNGLRLFFNIWLFRGIEPEGDKTQQLIIRDFTFQPRL